MNAPVSLGAASPSRKLPHSLHEALDGADFLTRLEIAGVDLHAELEAFVDTAAVGVLLVGSLAEGLGNSSSDVDVIVLLGDVSQLHRPEGTVFLDVGGHREVLKYVHGVELNFTFVARPQLARVGSAFVAIAPALYDPSELRSLPMLDESDLRIVHRLKWGWPLFGDHVVEQWRDELLVDLIREYLTIRYFVEMNEHVEDVGALVGGPAGSAGLVTRTATRFGMLALLAHEGFTGPNLNWILHWCERVSDPELVTALSIGRDLLCEAVPFDAEGDALVWRRLRDFQTDVRRLLDRDTELARAIAYLAEEIAYVVTDV